MYEAVAARHARRPPQPLFHSALEVRLAGQRWVVEMTPVWGTTEPDRGVVAEGAVGARFLGRSRLFRYEVRRWRDGTIGDVAAAVGGPRPMRTDTVAARAVLALVRWSPPSPGDATSCAPARCGTRTRWSRGCWPAAGTT
jgi:hypothetical protein